MLGEPATPRSDLFSFGVVLYELLTGTHPFLRETVADTMTAILRADPPPLTGAVPGAPPAALRVIEHCLEKQPSERPSSARDVAMFLDASGNTSVEAAAAVFTDNVRASARRLQLKVVTVSCGLLLAVVATTWGYVRTSGDRAVNAALGRDLERAGVWLDASTTWRLERLQLTARLLASFPELKALFEATDAATIRDFLLAYQQQNPGTPLLVAIEPFRACRWAAPTRRNGWYFRRGGLARCRSQNKASRPSCPSAVVPITPPALPRQPAENCSDTSSPRYPWIRSSRARSAKPPATRPSCCQIRQSWPLLFLAAGRLGNPSRTGGVRVGRVTGPL